MNYKNPDFYRRSENFFPKRDNSAILRRALNKKYKEDTSDNVVKNNPNNNIQIYEDYNDNKNINKNFLKKYNTQKRNFNSYNNFNNNYNANNALNLKNNKEADYQKLLYRMNNNKNKYIMKKYYTTNISEDNVYEEFIINYDSGMNPEENNKLSNTLDRKKPYMNNKIYNRVAVNNGIYKISKSKFNHMFGEDNVEYFNSTYHPYQKRRVLDINEKESLEDDIKERIRKEINFKNNRNNFTNYNFFDKNSKKKNYEYSFNTYNHEQNMLNYDNRYNNFLYNNNINIPYNNKTRILDTEERINEFLEHFSEYCVQYYHRIIRHLFTYLKKAKKNLKDSVGQKYMIINHKKTPVGRKNSFNISTKKKVGNKVNYYTNNNNERIPYHKSTALIIDRIRSNNESKSPDKKNNIEMFRNIEEMSKKFETINNRKNRLSQNKLKNNNDLSFTSGSVEKNKQKEKWDKTLEKEREFRRKKQIIKNKKNNINNNIYSNINNKKNLILIQNDESMDNKDNTKNNFNISFSSIDKQSIRKKYKNKKLNEKALNKKYTMIILKRLQTHDKKIFITIKCLNCYKPLNQNNKEKNFDFNKIKNYKKSDNISITLNAIKVRNQNIKIDNNNIYKKLSSIIEEKENKIELSEEGSQNENENEFGNK